VRSGDVVTRPGTLPPPHAGEGKRSANQQQRPDQAMSILEIALVPCLKDNYAYLLRDPATGAVAVVDPSEAAPVEKALKARGWKLTHILNTHHHWDHTGGNPALKAATGAVVVGPRPDKERIPDIDVAVDEGESFKLGEAEARILFIPGHT